MLFEAFETSNCPGFVIFTDEPLRAKMLVAHHLEYAATIYEQDDISVCFGSYKQAGIAVVSTGFRRDNTAEFLREAKRSGATGLIYLGECVSHSRAHPLRTVINADGGDPALLAKAQTAASRYDIPVTVAPVLPTCNASDGVMHGAGGIDCDSGGVVCGAAFDFYSSAKECNLAALSVLTVTKNTGTGEQMEEHERRSRLYNAARLAFETAVLY